MSRRIRMEKNGMAPWIEEMKLPAEDVSMEYTIAGSIDRLSLEGMLSAVGDLQLTLDMEPSKETWSMVLFPHLPH